MEKQIVLYVVRHGSTDLNQADCFRGDADPPLSTLGYREANQVAHYLQPIEVSFIVASAKKRAVATADIINIAKKLDGCNLQVHTNHLLFPWSVGTFSGKPKNKENLDKLQKYIDHPGEVIPGGESLNCFRDRVRPIIEEALDTAEENTSPGMIVVHSSIVHELGQMFNNDHQAALIKPGGVAVVYVSNGMFRVEAIFRPEYGEHNEAS
jgi:broad specificity phosphatase PhoE